MEDSRKIAEKHLQILQVTSTNEAPRASTTSKSSKKHCSLCAIVCTNAYTNQSLAASIIPTLIVI